MNPTYPRLVFRKALFLLLTMLNASLVFGQEKDYFYTNKGSIRFRSDAPQEIISADSEHLQGLISPVKKTFIFRVVIRTFAGFNSALQQEHFNEKYLESEKFPEAVFTGKIIEDVNLSENGTYSIRAKGKLNIHGVEQERIIKSNLEVRNGTILIRSQFSVLLADHAIKVPKVVHEKIASEITVDVNAVLTVKTMR